MATLAATIQSDAPAVRRGAIARVTAALLSRLVLFAAYQALVALAFVVRGHPAAWSASVAWWPLSIVAANLTGLALLRALLRAEGDRLANLWRIDRSRVGGDVIVTLGMLLLGGLIATAPNLGLATLLWGNADQPLALFVRPLPIWAGSLALVAFPLTIALSELPTYYGYARPRLERLGIAPWRAVGIAALSHALQHAALPLLFDVRFLVWRGLMFLPFALFVGAMLRWRPRLMPYLMIAHGFMDLAVAVMILRASLS